MSIKKYKITLVALVFAMAFSVTAFAQVKTYNEQITVVAPFDPIIPDAFKISQNPVADDTTTSVPVMNYNIMPHIADVKPVIDPLPAVKLVAEPLSKLYRNYIRGGVGNYSALYGELFMSSLRSKQYLTSLHLKHQSAAGEIKDYGSPQNSRNEAELNGSKYFALHTLTGKAFYYRDGLHLYGYKPADFPDTLIEKDDVKQHYYTAGASTTFSSNYKDAAKLNHTFGLSYYHMAGTHVNIENNAQFTATIDKRFDLFKIETDQVLGISAGYNFLNQSDSLGHINSGILLVNPFIKAQINEYSFMAGFKLNVASDSLTKGHIYPVAEARLELIPNALKLYAGISGGMERTSLQSITEQNSYISSVIPWNYVYDKFKIYGGFQSNISRSFNFNGSVSSSTYENYPLFVTDTNAYLLNSFTVIYDNISTVKLKGELEFIKSEHLRLAFIGNYTHYKTIEQEHAWYKPAYEFELTGRYDMQNKIAITSKIVVNGPVWALVPVEVQYIMPGPKYIMEAQQLKGWADINLGTEYRFNKALSFWLNFNNITNSKYNRWYNYRSYGINVMGGASYSF
ncbi:MAG: hypothetical protein WCI92_03085 [Bacteroidota bacterium]